MNLTPDETLMMVRAIQFELQVKRALFVLPEASVYERKRLLTRIELLRTWLAANNFNTEGYTP